MEPIRILIADDHPLFRDGLRVSLESVPDMQVLGEATAGNEVMAQAHTLQPDLILMDIKMPGSNGIEATRRILQTNPHIRILILTIFEDDESVFAAICSREPCRRRRFAPFVLWPAVRPSLVRLSPSA